MKMLPLRSIFIFSLNGDTASARKNRTTKDFPVNKYEYTDVQENQYRYQVDYDENGRLCVKLVITSFYTVKLHFNKANISAKKSCYRILRIAMLIQHLTKKRLYRNVYSKNAATLQLHLLVWVRGFEPPTP